MQHHPHFQRFLAAVILHRHSTEMGGFGMSARKPTWLYSSHAFISEIEKYRVTSLPEASAEMTVHRYNALGRLVIDGGNSYYIDDSRRAAELKERVSTTSIAASAAAFGVLRRCQAGLCREKDCLARTRFSP